MIIIIVVTFIKIVFGTIELYNPLGYPTHKIRFYEVSVNDKLTSVDYTTTHKIPIIPYLINFNSKYFGVNIIEGDSDYSFFASDGSTKYILNINSYSCYSGKYQIECKSNDQITKKNNDTKYTKLKIVRTTNPYEEVYNGKFKKDISEYVKKRGRYSVTITAEYSLVDTEIYFYFDNYIK